MAVWTTIHGFTLNQSYMWTCLDFVLCMWGQTRYSQSLGGSNNCRESARKVAINLECDEGFLNGPECSFSARERCRETKQKL